ncbi:STAS domain-containing protein [Streptomyces sp. NBC_01465]|uniref:STAS domain-containing protein n=1 Tax=Streptomyces sp. NBC_01465 TaxID=2903878 RepID=UPI002E3663C5|nr:STAS domain-containing protein [Streptomyces sp. NBC_01465]
MSLPQLNVYRHDRKTQALVTLSGELDLETADLVRESLQRCLRDGILTVDVDLTPLVFCDCSGLNVFLQAWQEAENTGATLQLHWPPPILERLLALTECDFLVSGAAAVPVTLAATG